jgi:hypothetical protein
MILQALIVVALGLQTAAPQATTTANLVRTYKADETTKYELKFAVDSPDEKMKGSAELTAKVKKLLDKGRAQVEVTAAKLKAQEGDRETPPGTEGPPPLDAPFDIHGIPTSLGQDESQIQLYGMLTMCMMLPGRELKVGETATVKWESEDKDYTIAGKFKLLEVVEKDGKKIAKIESDLTIQPPGESIGWKGTSEIDLRDGSLIKGKASAIMPNDTGTIEVTVERLKQP